ncbi:MAG: exodeoxyribonuclease VII large subunit [Hyphomicrobiales bacterium]|nr:exodeoxyribonuclease VII large subunit [Hyphomicrobiales bacterium]
MADKNTNALELTVSELSFSLKKMVEDNFGYVRVRGELGRVSRPASGHIYLDLKDDKAVLNGVIWKGVASRLKHRPEEGLEIIACGKLTTFPGSSKYQIVIDNIEPAGAGALMALLEERKKKLTAEGLFDESRKQLLPYLPNVIGVVTSPTGSVVRDVLHRLKDRFPLHVIVWPVRVQGENCAQEVSNAVRGFNAFQPGGQLPRPDIIIVARGGGSIEDLWGFNEELVVRATADSQIPLISAVGHETDWTLIDLAADIRAPTPTAAAEMAVRVHADLDARILTLGARLQTGIRRVLDMQKNHMRAAERGLSTPQSLLDIPRQRFDTITLRLGQGLAIAANTKRTCYEKIAARLSLYGLSNQVKSGFEKTENVDQRISRAIRHLLDKSTSGLEQADRLLGSLSYVSVLQRGFAVIMDEKGKAITSTGTIRANSLVNIRMKDGEVKAQTLGSSTSTVKVSTTKSKPPALGQGDLF